jgi:hypothetical protein
LKISLAGIYAGLENDIEVILLDLFDKKGGHGLQIRAI